MPILRRNIPSYRKHRASGQAIVTLSGRDFYLGPYGTKASRQEYDRLIGEWLQQGRRIGGNSTSRELTVVELIAAYLKFAHGYYCKEGVPTSDYPALLQALRQLKLLYGRQPVDEFGPIALQAVMQKMVECGWARRTVNNQAGRIKRMFRWGVSQELIPAHLSHALASVAGLRNGRTDAREAAPQASRRIPQPE